MLIKIGELKPPDYKGIRVMAAHGLHSDIFDLMKPFLREGMRILDFGCGEGAFSQRLIDAGMNVDGCDINTDQIKAMVNRKITLDLDKEIGNQAFSEKYDLLIAMEILEHLQNPWKYVSDCMSLVKDDGIIVLSTPNISNFASRLRFFMRGSLMAFEKPDFVHGHITPLSFIQLENMFDKLGLTVLKKGHAGTLPLIHISGFSLFSMLRNSILLLFYPFMSGPKKGRALVYVLKKKS
jgi:2-polyprenyl-3-methyl-5-hydroxy-6-metoxy-1,4-benzoquinol methylase